MNDPVVAAGRRAHLPVGIPPTLAAVEGAYEALIPVQQWFERWNGCANEMSPRAWDDLHDLIYPTTERKS